MRAWGVWAVLAALLAFQLAISRCAVENGESAEGVVDKGIDTGHTPGTDADSMEREAEAMSTSGKVHKLREHAQKFNFQAEVTRLMDIIINSLYSNKDIFLRELISNASDALDKIRFLALTDKKVLGEGDAAELDIRLSLDMDNKVLKIRDKGIGMTKDDLIRNLGTIAKSGTSAFLEKIQKAGDLNLIGQFGVGFYSVFLVADYVEVISKHNDDKQYVWESKADGSFAISEDTEGETLGRGTQINVHLREDCQEYANVEKVTGLIKKYSEFINFPIYMYTSKEVEVEEEEVEDEDEETDGQEEDVEDEEGDEEEEDADDTKEKKTETVWDWELQNESKAIWLRSPSKIGDEEYQNFYKAISKVTYGESMTWTHFTAEGDVDFRALLFVPERAPFDFYDRYYDKEPKGVKLYVRRVFISDEFDDLLPRYLSFLIGVIDSDSLPLNVSREMLQQHSALKTIRRKLVKKVLEMLKKMADAEREQSKEEEEKEEEEEEKEEEQKVDSKKVNKYSQFWKEFGRAIKFGIIEDHTNRKRLANLIRFHTSKSPDKLIGLEEYVSRMKEGQKNIYYLAGQTLEEVQKSPFLENLHKKGLEVIYFTEAVDEYMMQHLLEFDDKKFMDASKEDLKFGDKDDKDRKKVKEEFKTLTAWWKELLGTKEVDKVRVSNRLATTPCIVVTSRYGWSANMERIMKSQSFSDPMRQVYMKGQKSLEINPRHPLIKELKAAVEKDKENEAVKEVARLVYESALLESGFVPEDTKVFARRLQNMVKGVLGMKGDLDDIDETPFPEEDVEEDEEDEDNEGESFDFAGDMEDTVHIEKEGVGLDLGDKPSPSSGAKDEL